MKNKLVLSFLSLSLLSSSLYSMLPNLLQNIDMESAIRTARDIANDIESNHQVRRETEARRAKERIQSLERKISLSNNAEERALYIEQLKSIYDQNKRSEERSARVAEAASNLGLQIANQGISTIFNMAQEEHRAENELNKAAATAHIKAEAEGKTYLEGLQRKLDFIRDPQNIKPISIGITVTALGIFAAKHGVQLGADALRHYYRNPSIAQETSLLSLKEKIEAKIFGSKIASSNIKDVILEPALDQRFKIVAKSIKNTVKHGTYFQNILLYGPPGTGKTMMAQRLARSSGLEYIYFAASSLLQLSTEEALIKITELFEFAKNSSKKLMIIVDEAEKLFAHRKNNLDNKTRNILTQILTYTGTESRDFLIVALTNLPGELDPAFLSRCDEQIQISPPQSEQRKLIIKKYIKDYLLTPINNTQRKKTIFTHIINSFKKTQPLAKLTIEKGALNKDIIDEITQQTEGFVGRDIAKMILSIQAQAYATKSKTLTLELINQVVKDKIAQHNKSNSGFKDKFDGI